MSAGTGSTAATGACKSPGDGDGNPDILLGWELSLQGSSILCVIISSAQEGVAFAGTVGAAAKRAGNAPEDDDDTDSLPELVSDNELTVMTRFGSGQSARRFDDVEVATDDESDGDGEHLTVALQLLENFGPGDPLTHAICVVPALKFWSF